MKFVKAVPAAVAGLAGPMFGEVGITPKDLDITSTRKLKGSI